HQPPRPEGVNGGQVGFADLREPARREWFLSGTGQGTFAEAPAFARRPRIANPVSGAVYAFDPDIPSTRQSVGVAITGETANLSLTLDGKPFAPAAGNPQMPLIKGSHLLALTDEGGRVMDRVRFSVR
ncbi:MAG: penicillin-binding protein 1C, partial [Novosphingobium sp.]